MKSCEINVSHKSNYYVYTPSLKTKDAFLYPVCTGHFIYEPGYSLRRNSYDSFLIIYIQKGELHLKLNNSIYSVCEGQFVFIDCYQPHAYFTETKCESIWLHFDGRTAASYYKLIHSQLGYVFSLTSPYMVLNQMSIIYNLFSSNSYINEIIMSKYITDILTELATQITHSPTAANNYNIIEKTISYISNHITGDLSIATLADYVSLSSYHFIRMFKKETGFTPHEYIVQAKINISKFMLRNTSLPIKEICYSTGFSSESVFSTTFKKHVGLTPNKYRNSPLP